MVLTVVLEVLARVVPVLVEGPLLHQRLVLLPLPVTVMILRMLPVVMLKKQLLLLLGTLVVAVVAGGHARVDVPLVSLLRLMLRL